MLQLGLGAGSVPKELRKSGIHTDVVEISPTIVEAAREFFAFPKGPGQTFVADATEFLGSPPVHGDRYDVVLMDLFNGYVCTTLNGLRVLPRACALTCGKTLIFLG